MSSSVQWFKTTLRIKEPTRSIEFYNKNFGFRHVDTVKGDKSSLYQLAILKNPEEKLAEPGTPEAHAWLDRFEHVILELRHDHGSEKDDNFSVNNGNVEPHRGFGHIAVNCEDVYASCAKLENAGVKFQKKPDEGRMKGLAFALDLDGYWIEVVERSAPDFKPEFNLSQTMLRVKDPKKSLKLYTELLGMTLCREIHFPKEKGDFSLYFLATLDAGVSAPPSSDSDAQRDFVKKLWQPVLELTHNHGTEDQADFAYHNGNTDPKGFYSVGFRTADVAATAKALSDAGFTIATTDDGTFAHDYDNYWVQLLAAK